MMTHQFSFDPLRYFDAYMEPNGDVWCCASAKEASAKMLATRNGFARLMRKELGAENVRGWTLTNQLRKYKGFGEEDGRWRNVYMLNITCSDLPDVCDKLNRFMKIAGVQRAL